MTKGKNKLIMISNLEVSEIKISKFMKWIDSTHFKVLVPPVKVLETMDKRELCIIIACKGLKFRTIEKSIENANWWLEMTKETILKDFFDIGKSEEQIKWERIGF